MKYLTSKELRTKYLKFFENYQHKIYDSASLIPDDPTMLLTIAGMVPFKPFFLGKKLAPTPRIASCQKCIRTNDLDNVGKTARHQTFFEMLGNFAFGDYFKEEAIVMAWEFITKELGIERDRLWITVYEQDDESIELWENKAGVSRDRIVKMGAKDNFWEVGPTGSCGPCSEIHIDRGEEHKCGPECNIGCECDRFLEIWNLVFTEFNKLEDGSFEPLPKKNIDTGMGLERICSVMQNVDTNFDTDLFVPIINTIENIIPNSKEHSYEKKVIADHVRAATFMISDGILPSNEGRGYILRKLLRRASTYARRMNFHEAFLSRLVDVVVQVMGEHYRDLQSNTEYIKLMIDKEEERFQKTLDQGLDMLTQALSTLKLDEKLSGETAFKLYDTYGFPYELTQEIARESGHDINKADFEKSLNAQRENSRSTRDVVMEQVEEKFIEELAIKYGKTDFVGYKELLCKGKIIHLKNSDKNIYDVIFDKTPFYAESGGQVADHGKIISENFEGEVIDVSKKQDIYIHKIKVVGGSLDLHSVYDLEVSAVRRKKITANHTAAHLVHAKLREHLGKNVHQAGSHIDDKRMRFDFSYFQAVDRDLIQKIEKEVNEIIWKNSGVSKEEMSFTQAESRGALAFFDDKYQDFVRVIEIEGESIELCGGTHVDRTGDLGMLKILSEAGISAGVRRIEAITGYEVYRRYNFMESELDKISDKLKANRYKLIEKLDKLVDEMKEKDQTIEKLKEEIRNHSVTAIAQKFQDLGAARFFFMIEDDVDIKDAKLLLDSLKQKFPLSIFVYGVKIEDNLTLLISLSKELSGRIQLDARDIMEHLKVLGFKGGGRPDIVQAGISKSELTLSFKELEGSLKEFIKGKI